MIVCQESGIQCETSIRGKKGTSMKIIWKHITQLRERLLSSAGLININCAPFLVYKYTLGIFFFNRSLAPYSSCSHCLVQAHNLQSHSCLSPPDLWSQLSPSHPCRALGSSLESSFRRPRPPAFPLGSSPFFHAIWWLLAPLTLCSAFSVLLRAFIFYSDPGRSGILTSLLHLF